jgi:hypothetical protein
MRNRILDVLERSASTFVETFLGLLIVTGLGDVNGIKVAAVAGLAAALSVIKNALTELIDASNGGVWWQDAIERTVWTYLQAFLALVLVNGTVDFTSWRTSLIAAVPAALAILKSVLAHFTGNPNTAALLPAAVQ